MVCVFMITPPPEKKQERKGKQENSQKKCGIGGIVFPSSVQTFTLYQALILPEKHDTVQYSARHTTLRTSPPITMLRYFSYHDRLSLFCFCPRHDKTKTKSRHKKTKRVQKKHFTFLLLLLFPTSTSKKASIPLCLLPSSPHGRNRYPLTVTHSPTGTLILQTLKSPNAPPDFVLTSVSV